MLLISDSYKNLQISAIVIFNSFYLRFFLPCILVFLEFIWSLKMSYVHTSYKIQFFFFFFFFFVLLLLLLLLFGQIVSQNYFLYYFPCPLKVSSLIFPDLVLIDLPFSELWICIEDLRYLNFYKGFLTIKYRIFYWFQTKIVKHEKWKSQIRNWWKLTYTRIKWKLI